MPQPTTSAAPADLRSADSQRYRWEVSGKPLAIEISLDVVERLGNEIVQTFRAITSRGSEIGGLLLGRFAKQPKPAVIIEDYEAIPCDYRRGPLYLLAEEDRRRLEEALQRWRKAPARDLSVVGYFRSNTRRELVLDEEDQTLIRTYFAERHHVILLVKPFASKPSLAGFFLWEGDSVPPASGLTFPFHRAELLKAEKRPQPEAAAPTAAPAPPAAPVRPTIQVRIAVAGPDAIAPPAAPPAQEARAAELPADGKPQSARRIEAPPAAGPRAAEAAKAPEQAAPVDGKPAAAAKPAAEPKPAEIKPPAAAKPAAEPKPAEIKPAAPAKPAEQAKPAGAAEAPPAPATTAAATAKAAVAPRAEAGAEATETGLFEAVGAEAAGEPGPIARLLKSRALWAVAALLLVALVGWLLWMRSGGVQPSAAPDASSLALRVERSGGQLLLSWNRSLPLLQTAQRAILSISDGDHREDVEMDLGQLRSGSIVYSPITSDVSFRLEVTDLKNGKSVSESVRVLGGRPSPTGPPAENAPAAKPSGSEAAPAEGAKTAQPLRSMAPLPPATRSESLAARLSPVEPIPAAEPPKVELPVSSAKPAVTPPPQEANSGAAGASTTASSPPPAQPAAQIIQPATASNSPVTQPAKPEAPPAQPAAEAPKPTTPAAAAAAAPPTRVGGVVQEAKLIRRRDPVYPPLARQARLQGVVRLEAVIGPDGRVEQVQAISGPPLLRQAAMDAVKQWVYQPSLLNGQPVRVTTQVEVNFTLGR